MTLPPPEPDIDKNHEEYKKGYQAGLSGEHGDKYPGSTPRWWDTDALHNEAGFYDGVTARKNAPAPGAPKGGKSRKHRKSHKKTMKKKSRKHRK